MIQTHFFCHHAADPYFNMAFDGWMLEYVLGHPDSALMRLYTWGVGTITLGLNQESERAVRRAQLGATPLIRRLTGGRAVYHDVSELTYSLAVNRVAAGLGEPGDAMAGAYLRLAGGLQNFLAAIGLEAKLVRRSSGSDRAPLRSTRQPCFASAARYELTVGGDKVVASAQRRIGETLLQHGSIKLQGVASHPALPGAGPPDLSLQPLEQATFERFTEPFVTAMGAVLGGEPGIDSARLETSDGLRRRLERLRSDPLGRHDTFEQS